MTLEKQVLYEFEGFRLNPRERSLRCGSRTVSLTPKSFDILVTLIDRNGSLVTKDELLRKIWPDSFVEEANLTVNVSALRKALGDSVENPHFIETVPKVGYRFIAPVTMLRNGHSSSEAGTTVQSKAERLAVDETKQVGDVVQSVSTRSAKNWWPVIGLVAIVLLVPLGYWRFRSAYKATVGIAPEPRRLAILPFENVKQDAASDFLGYSLADAIITKLGHVQSLRVRPSYAIEKYRDKVVEISKVAADLDVDTLLTGNFIREGDNLRITCQLIDVKTRNLLWKGGFDLHFQKLLNVQDQVAEQVIRGLELNLSSTEAAELRRDEPANALAYEFYLRGVDLYARGEFPLAVRMLEKSSEIEPNYALAWAYLGRSYSAAASFHLEGRDYYRKAQSAFDRALSLQPSQIETQVYIANFLTDTGKVEQAVPLLKEALKANPHHAEVHWELGYAYRFAGMLKESIAECEEARRLDPGVKINSSALNGYLYLGQYEKFLESLPKNSELPFHVFYRGFGEYHLQRFQQAMEDFDRAFNSNPKLLQTQIGKSLSSFIRHEDSAGIETLRAADKTIQARGVGDPEALYKLAQAYAVLGDKESALRMLQHSIENGFFPYPYLQTDPLLDSLRKESQFDVLMQAARERHEAFGKAFF